METSLTTDNRSLSTASGWILAVLSTIAFSIATPLGKTAVSLGIQPSFLLLLRFIVAVVLTAVTLAIFSPTKLLPDRKGVLLGIGVGIINGLGVLSFFYALRTIDASVGSMIFSLNPLAILSLLALRGEKFTYRHYIRLGLGLLGAYLLIAPGGRVDVWGAFLAALNIFSFAIELALVQWFMTEYDSQTVSLYVLVGMLLIVSLFWAGEGAVWQTLDSRGWLVILAMAVVAGYFGWWAMFVGVRVIGSAQVALLMPLETLLSVLWAFIFLHERFNLWQVAGGVLILTSAMLAVQRMQQVKRN